MPVNLERVHEEVERSKRGDHGMLVELLRSDKPLPIAVREYIARELEKDPKKRFTRQTRRDLDVEQSDLRLIRLVAAAKLNIAWEIIERAIEKGESPLPPDRLGGLASADLLAVRWRHVSDRAALDRLSEEGFEFDDDHLTNAINRRRRDQKRRHELSGKNTKIDWYEYLKQRTLLTFRV